MTERLELHLSAQELFEYLAVGGNEEQASHLKACERCTTELRRNEMVAAGGRAAVAKWAESLQGSDTAFLKRLVESQRRRREVRFAQLSSAVLLMLLVPAAVVEQRRVEQKRRQADDVLLRLVDDAIAERVPVAMQPLTGLMTWPEDSDQGTGSTQQEETIREGTK